MSDNNLYPGMNFNPYTGERLNPAPENAEQGSEKDSMEKKTYTELSELRQSWREEGQAQEPAAVEQTAQVVQPEVQQTVIEPVQQVQPEVQQTVIEPVQQVQPEVQQVAEQAAQYETTQAAEPVQTTQFEAESSKPYFDRLNEDYGAPRELKKQSKTKTKERKAKGEKKQGGFFRKAFAAVILAAVFGSVAGGTFYGICKYTGVLDRTQIVQTPVLSEGQTEQAKLPATQSDVSEQEEKEIKLVNSDNIQVISTDISDMVEEVIPAMVTILNTGKEEYDWWGRSYASQSSGTGVIIGENDKELLIVTNHHVAKDAKKLEITFIDDTTVEARVKGMDEDMDLAVLSVPLESISEETKEKIVVAQLGDSTSLKLGQPAVVIGNALGIGISVTDGIISGLNREMTTEDGKTGTFIQTDAAVNHGNSGGALLNIKGEVIGIVSNKIDGESVEGMGYAIPISAASPIIKELIELQTRTEVVEEADQGYLGVSLQNVTSEARTYYGLPEGAYVMEVMEGSAAQKAGIHSKDVITKIDKHKITSGAEVRELLQYYRVGEEVTLSYSRLENGEYVSHEVTVVLGARPVEE